eukprot:scaffold8214_cov121-Isochrysis_galbana.AAC.22
MCTGLPAQHAEAQAGQSVPLRGAAVRRAPAVAPVGGAPPAAALVPAPAAPGTCAAAVHAAGPAAAGIASRPATSVRERASTVASALD